VFVYRDPRPRRRDINGDDRELAGAIEQPMARKIVGGHSRDAALLPRPDGGGAAAEFVAGACLYLDKGQLTCTRRDDVDFAEARSMPPGNYCVPPTLELGAGQVFPRFPQVLATC